MGNSRRITHSRERIEQLLEQLAVPTHERPFYLKDELEGDDPALPGLVLEREIKRVLIGRDETAWIDESIAQLEWLEQGGSPFCAPDPQLLAAFRAFKSSGLPPTILSTIVNVAQENLLNTWVRLLEDGQTEAGYDDVRWGLFEVDEDDCPGRKLVSLSRFLSLPLPDET